MDPERGVLGLYTDEPIGMDHPIFMARMEARQGGMWAARDGLSLPEMLVTVHQRVLELFGDVPKSLVDATATLAYLEALPLQQGDDADSQ